MLFVEKQSFLFEFYFISVRYSDNIAWNFVFTIIHIHWLVKSVFTEGILPLWRILRDHLLEMDPSACFTSSIKLWNEILSAEQIGRRNRFAQITV